MARSLRPALPVLPLALLALAAAGQEGARVERLLAANPQGFKPVTLENGKLVLRLLPNPDLVGDLPHWHYDVFEVVWRKPFPWFGNGKIQFVLNEQATVGEMKMNVPNNDFWFDELEFKRKK